MGRLIRGIRTARNGLRPRFLLLAIVTAIPLLSLLLSDAVIDRRETIHAAERHVVDLARLGAERQGATVIDAAHLMRVIGQIPAVRDMTPNACQAVLRQAADDDPRFATLAVARADGAIVCHSHLATPRANVADRDYFRQAEAAAPGAPAVSQVIVSRVSGKTVVVVAFPLGAAAAASAHDVMIAVLNLDRPPSLAASTPDGGDYMAFIVNPADGAIMARAPAIPALVDRPTANATLIGAFRQAAGPGSVTAPDRYGVAKIFGFAPMPVGASALLLGVGVTRADVVAQADKRLYRSIGMALAATLVALVLAWSMARSTVLHPIEALKQAAARLGAGDPTARAATHGLVNEMRALGLTFNRMAAHLQTRGRQLVAAQDALRISEVHHRLLADNALDMITRFDPEFRRVYVSPACYDLLGYRPDELVGQMPSNIVHPDSWVVLDTTLNAALKAGQPSARAVFRGLRKDGSCLWLEASGRRLADNTGYVVVTRDVTERKAFEQRLEDANRQLEALAMRDPLTNLANRRRFDEMVGAEYRRSQRLQCALSIVMIDADRFKSYNDIYGHPAGDACLRAIAQAIESVLRRPADLAARYGGEEFAVILPTTDQAGAVQMAGRIADAVRALNLPHQDTPRSIVTVSLGVAAACPRADDHDPAGLIEAADRALYAAKAAGRDTVRSTEVLRYSPSF